MKKKSTKKIIICTVIALAAIGILGIVSIFMSQFFSKFMPKHKSKADEPYVNLKYFKEYNEVRKLNGFTFTLTHGLYSEKTRTGCCVFVVEKDNGVMEMPDMVWDDNRIDYIGDINDGVCIMPMNGGTIQTRAKIAGDKMIAYVDFRNSPKQPEATEDYHDNQIYLFGGEDKNCRRDYSFRLEDNTGGKEYQVDDSTKLSLSYFGLSVESNHRMKNLTVELKDEKGKTKTFDFISSYADIEGYYGESSQSDEGYSKNTYSYTFNKINYNIIDQTKEIYVNGKKITG